MLRYPCTCRGVKPLGSSRRGATLFESTVVLSLSFLLLFAAMVATHTVFQRHQLGAMAREAARYASVHGGQYRHDAGLPPGTIEDWKADIYANALVPNMVGGLDANL